jgi:hypothetical protein
MALMMAMGREDEADEAVGMVVTGFMRWSDVKKRQGFSGLPLGIFC